MKRKDYFIRKMYITAIAAVCSTLCWAGSAQAEDESRITVIQELEEGDLEGLKAPEQEYRDENGASYRLDSWDIRQIPGEKKSRQVEQECFYQEVEGAQELPSSIPISSEGEETAAGRIPLKEARVVKEVWKDDFSMPVTFHSYGADGYRLGELTVEGEQALEQVAQAGQALLGDLGLSAGDYRINGLVWDGEPYMDEGGQLCRRATAFGEKCIRDYEALYQGEISWMEPDRYELKAQYRLEPVEMAPESQAELPEMVQEEEAPVTLWQRIRNVVMITMGIGILGFMAGLVILSAGMEKRRREQRYIPCMEELETEG